MEVIPLDVHDDAQCRQAYDVVVRSQSFQRPWHDPSGFAEAVLMWRFVEEAERQERYVALEGDRIVGALVVWLPMHDNRDKAWVELDVDPVQRGRGVGSALVQRAVERCRLAQRREMVAETHLPVDADQDHPHRRFATKSGFSLSSIEAMRHLALPVAAPTLDRLDRESAPRWQGRYHLETYVDGVPEHLQASVCDVSNLLAVDAPTGDIDYEAESMDPQRYRAYLELERQQGRSRATTVAVEDSTGEVVAYTDLMLPAGAPTKVWQWGTLVAHEHRGHRLGMAVKVANLRRLQADHPERQVVVTGNDNTNSFMVDINRALGFQVVEEIGTYHRLLV